MDLDVTVSVVPAVADSGPGVLSFLVDGSSEALDLAVRRAGPFGWTTSQATGSGAAAGVLTTVGVGVLVRTSRRELAAPIPAIGDLTVLSTDGASQLSRHAGTNPTETLETLETLERTTGLDGQSPLQDLTGRQQATVTPTPAARPPTGSTAGWARASPVVDPAAHG